MVTLSDCANKSSEEITVTSSTVQNKDFKFHSSFANGCGKLLVARADNVRMQRLLNREIATTLQKEEVPDTAGIVALTTVTPDTPMAFELPEQEKWGSVCAALAKASSRAPASFLESDEVALKYVKAVHQARGALETAFRARVVQQVTVAVDLMNVALVSSEAWSEQQDKCLETIDSLLQSPTSASDVGYLCLNLPNEKDLAKTNNYDTAPGDFFTCVRSLRSAFVLSVSVERIPRDSPTIVDFVKDMAAVTAKFGLVERLPRAIE